MTTEQCEVYVACASRSSDVALRFLNAVLPRRVEAAEGYPYPELSDEPIEEFTDAESLMAKLQTDTDETYGIYWDCDGDGDPHQAMLFYTEDGGLIAGVATTADNAATDLERLAGIVDGRFGYVAFEERPPDLMSDFLELCQNTQGLRLVDGQLRTA